MDAFITQVKMIKELRAMGLVKARFKVEDFFNREGVLFNREGLVAYILENLGYKNALYAEFRRLRSKILLAD